jgi:hypothetical protein
VKALDTVKGHNRRIFDKLQVRRRTKVVTRARALGLNKPQSSAPIPKKQHHQTTLKYLSQTSLRC